MKMSLPVRAGCPNSAYEASGCNGDSPGCTAHRQPFYSRRVAHFAACLTCTACTLTLAHQAMSFFPYGTLAEITQEIRSKKISPVEIIELHLTRIEALQPKLNAFVHLDPE